MKISGKFILKVAGTLTVISLVVAALLGLVDNVTADKIAAIDAENTRIAMSAVAPEGSEFGDKLDITDDMTAAAASGRQAGGVVSHDHRRRRQRLCYEDLRLRLSGQHRDDGGRGRRQGHHRHLRGQPR